MDGSSLVLTYDEALDEDSTPEASAYAVSIGGGTGAAPSGVVVSGSTVTLMLAAAVGANDVVTVSYTVPASGTVQDAEGNDAAALTDQAVTNDTAPVLLYATINAATLVLVYDAALDEGSTPSTAAFTVRFSGQSRAERSVSVSGDTVRLQMPQVADPGEAVTVEYRVPTTDPILSQSGNEAAALAARAVINRTVSPLVSNIGLLFQGTSYIVGTSSVTHWSVAQRFTTGGNEDGYALSEVGVPVERIAGTQRVSIYTPSDGVPGTSLAVLENPPTTAGGPTTFVWAAPAGVTLDGDTDYFVVLEETTRVRRQHWSVAFTISRVDSGASGWSIADMRASRAGDEGWVGRSDVIGISVVGAALDDDDSVVPSLASASVLGSELVLTYSEALDRGSVPPADAFTVKVNGGSGEAPVGVVVVGDQVTLVLATAIDGDDTVTVSYTAPAADPVRDVNGNDAAALSDQAVANRTSNNPPSGAPAISGTATGGETLSASTSGISDLDGIQVSPSPFSYQWLRVGSDGVSG